MPKKSHKKKIEKLTDSVKQCNITAPLEVKPVQVVFEDNLDLTLLSRWPKSKVKVPAIFLHRPVNFADHVKRLLSLGVKFYQPYLGTNFTKIFPCSFDDHKEMAQYMNQQQLPYHTFGHPSKKKMKVVIKTLPNDTNLDNLKADLKSAGIPIIRVHKMHMKVFAKDRDILVLAVVPFDDEGKKLLRVKQIYGHDVVLEPPKKKTIQCFLCQKWGHSQRYCHGAVKCVKCAGDHLTKKCTRDPAAEPPTCANCGGNHTASYRECFCCPDSTEYKKNRRNKWNQVEPSPHRLRAIVTLDNFQNMLYKKVKNVPKQEKAIPF